MSAVLHRGPRGSGCDLLSDAPAHDPRASAYLLSAYVRDFPRGAVFLCVVDRRGSAPGYTGRWRSRSTAVVGTGHGLFEIVARRGRLRLHAWAITWSPRELSATFHGRDLYAPRLRGWHAERGRRGRQVTLEPDRPGPMISIPMISIRGISSITTATASRRPRHGFYGRALLLRGGPLPRHGPLPRCRPHSRSSMRTRTGHRDRCAGRAGRRGLGDRDR